MPDEKHSIGGVEFSGNKDAEIHTGNINSTLQAGADITGRDKLTIGQQIFNLFTGSSDQQQDLRNRQIMLDAVRQFWVEGVLDNSLHDAALIALGMEEKKEAVHYPWDMVLKRPDQPTRQLPPDIKMIDVFDQTKRSLLILGEPGSGKTTMLLELARQTIIRAETDSSQPIPVVFNLSSWAEKRLKLAEWLVWELNTKYQIPTKTAQKWVENDKLLPLLDGLDEVNHEYRAACVEAINAFCRESWMRLVVCCRVADYEALPLKLNLEQAVVLQPLDKKQVERYLDQFEADLSTLKKTLHQDAHLQELAQSPLMLSIMALTYRGLTPESLPQFDSIEAQRQHLFEVYIRQMLARRVTRETYPTDKTCNWLSWLADGMVKHSQTEFLLERLQPSWLLPKQRRLYQVAVRMISGLIFGLLFGIVGQLHDELLLGLLGGLLFGLVGGLSDINPTEILRWSNPDFKQIREIFGLGDINPKEVLKWSWSDFKWIGLFGGLLGGLLFGLLLGLLGGLLGGLLFGLLGGLLGGLSGGLTKITLKPNQGIWSSLKNGLLFGLLCGLLCGLLFGLIGGLLGLVSSGLLFGLLGGLLCGVFCGLFSGLDAFIQHFILRFICYRQGYMPWNYVSFLDYATERILLRKVGGGYIFIHRYLMEYFASLESDPPAKKDV